MTARKTEKLPMKNKTENQKNDRVSGDAVCVSAVSMVGNHTETKLSNGTRKLICEPFAAKCYVALMLL